MNAKQYREAATLLGTALADGTQINVPALACLAVCGQDNPDWPAVYDALAAAGMPQGWKFIDWLEEQEDPQERRNVYIMFLLFMAEMVEGEQA